MNRLIYYSFIIILIKAIHSKFSTSPISQFQLIPNQQNASTIKQIIFSLQTQKISLRYFNKTQQSTFIKTFNSTTGQCICQNSSPDFNSYKLLAYSYQQGPISVRFIADGIKRYVPQIWSNDCKVQYQWSNITTFQYSQGTKVTKKLNKQYVAFSSNCSIQEYDLVTKEHVKTYSPGSDKQLIKTNIVYSPNSQYLITTISPQQQIQKYIAVYNTSTGNISFNIDKDNLVLKSLSNEEILCVDFGTYQIYRTNLINGSTKLVIKLLQEMRYFKQYYICTQDNLVIFSMYYQSSKTYKLMIYSSNPQPNKITDPVQILEFSQQEYGKIVTFTCETNKLAVINQNGLLRVFQYKADEEQNLQEDFPYLWVGLGGGLIICLLLGGGFYLWRRTKKNKLQNIDNTQYDSLIQQHQKLDQIIQQFLKPKSLIREQRNAVEDQQQKIPDHIIVMKRQSQSVVIKQKQQQKYRANDNIRLPDQHIAQNKVIKSQK